MNNKRIGLTSALIYSPISLGAAGIFLVITLLGDYTWVTRIGGAAWVLLLSFIITMPMVTTFVKKRAG